MVCIPCIVVPVFLFIWHRFIQPFVLKFWNPWKKVDDNKPSSNATLSCPMQGKKAEEKSSSPVLSCPMQANKAMESDQNEQSNQEGTALTNAPDKKND